MQIGELARATGLSIQAIRFYERWGFRRVGAHVFVVGKDPQNDLLMRRAL